MFFIRTIYYTKAASENRWIYTRILMYFYAIKIYIYTTKTCARNLKICYN